jgi:adenylate kinase
MAIRMFLYVMQDAINQYLEVRNKLLDTREELLEKLREIEKLLGSSGDIEAVQAVSSKKSAKKPGRKPGRKTSSKASEKASSSAAKGARKQNALSLKEVISKALTGGAMDRKAILEAVKNLGYKFSTNNPLNSLTVSLYTHKGIHKNGKIYSLKAGADKAASKKAASKKAASKKAASKKAAPKKAAPKKAAPKKAAS